MKASMLCTMVTVILFMIGVPCRKCFAGNTTPDRFYSQHGFSIAIPEGWRQVPNEVVQKVFAAAISDDMLTADIETVIAVEFGEDSLAYPYAIVQVQRYSKYGVDRPLNKDEIKKVFNEATPQIRSAFKQAENVENIAEQLPEKIQALISKIEPGKLYVDNKNMSFLLGINVEAPAIGKIRTFLFGSFGRFAWVKITFCCSESDWDRFRNDCNLIMNSFHFNAAMDYEGARKKESSFLKDLLVDFAVYGIIGGIILVIGVVGSLVSRKKTEKREDISSSAEKEKDT